MAQERCNVCGQGQALSEHPVCEHDCPLINFSQTQDISIPLLVVTELFIIIV